MTSVVKEKPIEDHEANAFALALLMPQDAVISYIRKTFPDGIDPSHDFYYEKVAAHFNVPVTLAAFRMGQLFERVVG